MTVDPGLVCRLERAAARAWPATIQQPTADGWLLRATPGLGRGRSNNALTPCRALAAHELGPAIERVEAFARRHGIGPGIQVSPAEMHPALQSELDRRGWGRRWPVLVLARSLDGPFEDLPLQVSDHASSDWLRAWSRCEQRPWGEVSAHADTVFSLLAGRACFARAGEEAVGISVGAEGAVGLFCLAVAPEQRRRGLGRALVSALLARAPEQAHDRARTPVAYLQVEERNRPALALYARLGFEPAYRYCHRVADQ